MNDSKALMLMEILIDGFCKPAGGIMNPRHSDLMRVWCVQGRTLHCLDRAIERALDKRWLIWNGDSVQVTQAGEEARGA